jgi:DNA-binding HxlR family transcriptional regulator
MTEAYVVQVFKCLSDKSRLQILKNLSIEPMYVELLAERLELTPSTVSFHLKKLMDAGLVSSKKEQYYVVYQMNDELFEKSLEELILVKSSEEEIQSEREKNYKDKILRSFFQMGKLKNIPVQMEKRKVILNEMAKAFEPYIEYTEKEVNIAIADFHDDFCTIRKYMVEEGILERDNGIYWLSNKL